MGAAPIVVLLVEDVAQEARLTEAMLARAYRGAFLVRRVPTLSAALERLSAGGVDVVLLDLGLPDSQGIATLLSVRQHSPETPVVVLTGADDDDLGVQSVRAGAREHLAKGQAGAQTIARAIRYALERSHADETLRATAEQHRAILRASPAGIIALDDAGRVTLWSAAAERLLGWSAQEASGRPLPIFDGMDNEGLDERLLSVQEGRSMTNAEVRARRKNGSLVDLSLSAAPLHDARGQCAGLIAIVVDISERKRLEAQILDVLEAEQRRLGRDLHDSLGQQLTGVQLTVSAIAERLAAKALPEAGHAEGAAALLDAAVREMRSLARGLCPVVQDAGGLPAALRSPARAVSDTHATQCLCTCDIAVSLDDRASADLFRIAQEAVNNAIRHGKADTLLLSLAEDAGRLNLTIQDDGVGIPAGGQPPKGMGIRTMEYRARRNGGELRIRRGPQRGTTLTCSIPYPGTQEPVHRRAAEEPRKGTNAEGARP